MASDMAEDIIAKSPMVISLDGNVGSGKSTLLALLKQNYKPEINERGNSVSTGAY